jgi:hypothetical protein
VAGTFKLNERGINSVLNSPRGDVAKDLQRRARLVAMAAKQRVGVDTGLLRKSIHTTKVARGYTGLIVSVRAPVHYALMHHNGTRPHTISKRPGRIVRFPSRGQIVFADVVIHPGTRPNPFLLSSLELAGDRSRV